jgi:hypothetical protein
MTKYQQLNRKKDLFWLTGSEVSVHYDGEGVAGQSSSHHGGQEAERERMSTLSGSLFVFLFISSGPPTYGLVQPGLLHLS